MNAKQRRTKRRAAPMQYVSCNYQGRHFGASYLDASCEGGYLIDDDLGGYDPSVTRIPCPQCNTEEWHAYHEDE